ncbi:MAG: hypothetical protein M1819_003237 [Sarea resinae]|nr:MAG: hypothetical protein M1819_003237 [Sarea resinae]
MITGQKSINVMWMSMVFSRSTWTLNLEDMFTVLLARVQELGGLIVNSVTIYQWNKDSDDLPDDTVAVVTNNDKTVRIFSLTSFKTLHTLEFPKAMNHATISPDGTLLVSVGDEERVYFHKLIRSKHADSILDSGQFEWKSCAKFKLTAVDDHCFSTAFSPSGRLCAVGSQDGIVTIFETELIASAQEDNDAVMRIMRSSRQGIMDGAVRSMCFSPEPWDLLIWAEDRGRICVADIRPASQWRQVVNINPKADDVDRAVVTDLADSLIDPELRELNSQADFIRRYHGELDAQDGDAAISFVTELIQASSERRRLQRQARSQDEEIGALTERERQLLDALRISRERMNARERRESQDRNSPFSISYLRPPSAGHDSGTTSSLLAADDYLALPSANSGSRDSTSGASSRRDYSRDHNNDRPRTGDHPYEPRRRRSVILSHSLTEPSSTAAADNSGSPRGQTEDTATAADPWRTIEAAMASGPLPNAASRLRREREAAIEASFERRQQNWTRMDVARREGLRNIYSRTPDADGEGLERYGAANLLRRAGRTHDGPGEVGTAGLALSEDGRTL